MSTVYSELTLIVDSIRPGLAGRIHAGILLARPCTGARQPEARHQRGCRALALALTTRTHIIYNHGSPEYEYQRVGIQVAGTDHLRSWRWLGRSQRKRKGKKKDPLFHIYRSSTTFSPGQFTNSQCATSSLSSFLSFSTCSTRCCQNSTSSTPRSYKSSRRARLRSMAVQEGTRRCCSRTLLRV